MAIQKLPSGVSTHPGVYLFFAGARILYVGKAANLRKRLVSYFRKNANEKVMRLRNEATRIEYIETNSEIEALLKEAELIKRHIPKYNVLMRDDKSYFYVAFTHEEFPRVFVIHKTQLDGEKYLRVIGPFTSGTALRGTLKFLRRIFPYCICKTPHTRPCLNSQIGKCLGYCCTRNSSAKVSAAAEEYEKNIRNIVAVVNGKRARLLSQLKREMHTASGKQEYERAMRVRDQIVGVENIFSHRIFLSNYGSPIPLAGRWNKIEKNIQTILKTRVFISRVEGYDISNISGTAATGSMVVFRDGIPAPSDYRKFKIKTVHGASDVAMHREVMRRRLQHTKWSDPDLMVIDGGKPQLNVTLEATRDKRQKTKMKIVALAKREEELYIEGREKPVRLDTLPREVMHFFQHVRNESHRFAKKYHHKLRELAYRENAQSKN